MALSQDLINQFVKLTEQKEEPKEVTVNGIYKTINGEEYVQIDGSEIWTPVTSTVEAETGERVKVMIKNHTATVTGNISSPSARSKSVKDLKDEVDEQGNTIKQLDNAIEQQGNSIIQIDNNIKQVNNDILQANNAINQQGNIIKQLGNEINQQGDVINSMNNDITANSNEITAINNTIVQQNNTITQHGNTIEQQGNIIRQQGNEINQHGNKIDQLDNNINQQGNAIEQINNKVTQQDNVVKQHGNLIEQYGNTIVEQGNNIIILNSGFQIIDGVLTGLSAAIIDELKTNHLNAAYATVDFANINMAAVEKLFTESGIIKDLVVQEGKITGELVGVTIKGDLIEGNTIKADKLVVMGENGIYYKLNIDGINNLNTSEAAKFVAVTSKPDDWDTNYKDYYLISDNKYTHVTGDEAPTWEANKYYKLSSVYESALDGTNIVAKSVTADKVSVKDLVAFGATIGGFNITDNSIYTGKTNVNSEARGIYFDKTGQLALGDTNNYIKFFKDTDGQYKIQIKADVLYTSSNSKSISEQLNELYQTSDDAVKSINKLYFATNSKEVPSLPTAHVTLADDSVRNQWNTVLPIYDEAYQFLYVCDEILTNGGEYSWTKPITSSYAEVTIDIFNAIVGIQTDYVTNESFTEYSRIQKETNTSIETQLKRTQVTVYGDPDLPDGDPDSLVNKLESVRENLNETDAMAKDSDEIIKSTGLDQYNSNVFINERFVNMEDSVEQIKRIFQITGGNNLLQNSVGYFNDNNGNPLSWDIGSGTIYKPYGYDADLTGLTISRGKLFCAKGNIVTSPNNIAGLIANKILSVSFKYKNAANTTTTIKIFNGSVTFFEKTFSSEVSQWTEYEFNPDTDPVLANPTFKSTVSSLQISITSSTSGESTGGFSISDLMLNYGDPKPWEMNNGEVYGAVIKLSSLGIELTANVARTKNFLTSDGILVYEYDPDTQTVNTLVTKLTDNGTLTKSINVTDNPESVTEDLVNGDIVQTKQGKTLRHTMITDSSSNKVFVEYII